MNVHNTEIIFLPIEVVIAIHDNEIRMHGGSYGIRDRGLLESAIETPKIGFGDSYLHNNLFEMASAYMYHIIKNHPFVDGNKRTGTASAFTFLEQNEAYLIPPNELVITLAEQVATSQLSKEGLAKYLEDLSSFGPEDL